jgi:hypothetical protein
MEAFIRCMSESTGYWGVVAQTGVSIDEICQALERSNHLKKKARIVEGSRTRVEPSEAELSLKSAELVFCIVGLIIF